MWSWDQGRLDYFQFDALRKVAKLAVASDLKALSGSDMRTAVGLPFLPNSASYPPWRNYSRIWKLALLVADGGTASRPTAIAHLLASDGLVTADEYFHFLAAATTAPSPALAEWDHAIEARYPLLFSLKYLLARSAIGEPETSLADVVSAYVQSGFSGDEDQAAFLAAIRMPYRPVADVRQAIESIRVLAQISYLNCALQTVNVSLTPSDAMDVFEQLGPVGGARLRDGGDEIIRVAALYPSAVAAFELEYSSTVVSDTTEAGFVEGTRVERTHLRIERNSNLRTAYFNTFNTVTCDFCGLDTAAVYPWVDRTLDIHHVLPLCSGARAGKRGTVLDDLVATCPTCHRAVHNYYSRWLKGAGRADFADGAEARAVYEEAKEQHRRAAR